MLYFFTITKFDNFESHLFRYFYDMCKAQLFPHCYFNQVCVGDSIKIKLKKLCIGDGLFSFI